MGPLDEHTVVIVAIDLEAPCDPDVLDADERRRAYRFVFEHHRRQFIASHVAVRLVLGRYLGMAPESLRFVVGPFGKPKVAVAPVDVRFSLSHSEERALLAVALGREVGVDIERHQPIATSELANHVFSDAEQDELRRAPTDERGAMFFRGWTRKESFIKALGDGMQFPLTAFDVSLAPSGRQLLRACRILTTHETARWTVQAIPVEQDYAAAVTVEGNDFRVVLSTMADYEPAENRHS